MVEIKTVQRENVTMIDGQGWKDLEVSMIYSMLVFGVLIGVNKNMLQNIFHSQYTCQLPIFISMTEVNLKHIVKRDK